MKVRSFLKGRWVAHSFIVGALVLLLLFAFLPACAPEVVPPPEEEEEEVVPPPVEPDPYADYVAALPEGCEPVPRECFEQAQEEGQLNIYNWAAWWPEEMFTDFEQEFGIRIVRDNYANYDEMISKYRLNPELEYDYSYADHRAFPQLRELGVLRELNHDWIPNVNKYLMGDVKNIVLDPGYKNMVPWFFSLNGYGINTNFVDENDPLMGTWAFIFENAPNYGDTMVLKENMFRVIGSTLKYLGYSCSSDDEEELMEAKEALLELKPHIMAFESWPRRLILEEECYVTWPHSTADFYELYNEGPMPTLKAYLPEEGAMQGVGCGILYKPGPHPAAGHLWLNYVFRPDVYLNMVTTVGRIPSHTEAVALLPEEMVTWPGLFPPEGYLAKCEILEASAFTGKGLELRTAIWEELKE